MGEMCSHYELKLAQAISKMHYFRGVRRSDIYLLVAHLQKLRASLAPFCLFWVAELGISCFAHSDDHMF